MTISKFVFRLLPQYITNKMYLGMKTLKKIMRFIWLLNQFKDISFMKMNSSKSKFHKYFALQALRQFSAFRDSDLRKEISFKKTNHILISTFFYFLLPTVIVDISSEHDFKMSMYYFSYQLKNAKYY